MDQKIRVNTSNNPTKSRDAVSKSLENLRLINKPKRRWKISKSKGSQENASRKRAKNAHFEKSNSVIVQRRVKNSKEDYHESEEGGEHIVVKAGKGSALKTNRFLYQ